jgi:hypothetical protein
VILLRHIFGYHITDVEIVTIQFFERTVTQTSAEKLVIMHSTDDPTAGGNIIVTVEIELFSNHFPTLWPRATRRWLDVLAGHALSDLAVHEITSKQTRFPVFVLDMGDLR